MAEVENQHEHAPFSEENEEEDEKLSMMSADQAFLTELNLILVLSYLSCPEQFIDFNETMETEYVKEQIANHSSSGLPKKAHGLSEFRAVGRQQISRCQPKMVDCRHNRRM